MYMCIHTCAHTHTRFFFHLGKEGAVWHPECEGEKTPPQYPGLPFRDAEIAVEEHPSGPVLAGNDSVGTFSPPHPWTPRSALRRAGVFPLDSAVWAPWALVAVVASLLAEDSRVSLLEKHRSCCLLSARHGSASGGRGPSLLQKAQLRPCLALFHEVNEKILLTHLSSISVPGMRALKKGIEP